MKPATTGSFVGALNEEIVWVRGRITKTVLSQLLMMKHGY